MCGASKPAPSFSERTGTSWRERSCGLLSSHSVQCGRKQLLWVMSFGHVSRLPINQDGLRYVEVTDKPRNLSCSTQQRINFSKCSAGSCLLALGRPLGVHGFQGHCGGGETDGRGSPALNCFVQEVTVAFPLKIHWPEPVTWPQPNCKGGWSLRGSR